jgi:6-phosphogluconolactonase
VSGPARLKVVEDPARVCAERMLEVARGGGHIVLTGGSTPRGAYEMAAEHRDAFGATTFWFGDERCVPPDDDRSNYKMARESLLSSLDEDYAPVVHRMEGELGPDAGADAYEQVLRDAGTPAFDLLLLGIGPDGHTASLFPDQKTVGERSRLVVGVAEAGLEPFVPRVSFTLSAIALAREVMFLVAGGSKADAVAAAFGPHAVPGPHVPSSLVATVAANVVVVLDEAAAGKL